MSSYTFQNSNSSSTLLKEEINSIFRELLPERRRYNEFQLLKEIAYECTEHDCNLSTELKTKVYNVLKVHDLKEDGTLLGLNLTCEDLTYEEKYKLREAAEQILKQRYRSITKGLSDMGLSISEEDILKSSKLSEQDVFGLDKDDKDIIDLIRVLNEKYTLYVNMLEELISIYEEITKMKTITVPEVVKQKVEEDQIQIRILHLRSDLISVKSRVDAFKETPIALDAYKEMLKDILQQQAEVKQEIEKLKDLKGKYEQVSCKQYDEILKSYIQYKQKIEQRRLLMNPNFS